MNTKSKKSRNPGTINGTGNKKRTFGILAGLALAISLTILIFSGCDTSNDTVTNADVAAVNAAISKLDYTSITFAVAEDKDNVRSDFTLPLSGDRGTAISWESSNTDIVSIDQDSAAVGSLRTGAESIVISLTATVSKGSAKQSKSFDITVWANDNVTPGVPGGLRISQWAADSLYLEWEEALPGRVGGEAGTIIGYTVYYSTSDDFLNLEELRSANQSIVLGQSTTTQVTGLESGTQYYFAATASNDSGEGPVSPSLETHTNTPDDFVPDAPAIIGRSAGNRQVELTWTAPAVTGWKDGQVIAISGYNIYQDPAAITDTTGLTAKIPGIAPEKRTWEVSGLTNGTEYYFAVSALIGEDKETLPGGGDISVTPNENIRSIGDVLSLSVEDFAALTGTSGQVISVDITASGLTYGTDYMVSISKAGSSVEALVYNPDTQEIDLADTIGPVDAGSYTIRASGMGQYNEAVTDDFELTVNPSDTSLLEQALKALSYADMRFAANEDQSSVYSDFTLPLTGLHGSSIDWKSDNPVVAISGSAAAVDPPDEGTVVTLTAELYLNAENASKEFIIVLTHPPNTLPGAPGNLAFTSWDTEAIGLSWSAEDSGYVDGSKASISAYTVYYSETGDFSDLTALKNAGQYVEVSAAADSEAETKAIVSGLTSGVLYSFAVSAANSTGEGPLSSSIETHTNSSPDAPVIIGRSAADQQIVLTWAAPAISGWTDGHENIISSYDIYQAASAISDLSGLDVLETVNNVNPAGLQSYTVTGLANGSDYYFAVAAVTASGRSLPGGGDVSVSPGTTTDLDTVITLSVEDAAASTNTPDQSIAVSLNDGGLSYGQDYSITIIKGGRATTALSWDATGTTITVSSALSESDGGDYSIIASGMGAYGGNVSDPFTLTVNLSDTDAVAAAQAALDISTEAGGDLNAVTVSQIALPIDGRYDTAISWASSDENVIRADGTVIIPAVGSQDAEVTLTATISKNTANAQKTFNLIVKAPVDVKNTFPGEPTDLALSAWTDTSIELNWTAPDPGYVGGVPGSIRSYRVYYSESDDFSNLTGLDSSTGVTSPLTISNLSSGTLYYFAVSASNANGEGPVSPSVSTRTNSAPGTPGISARIAGDGQVGLNWLAPALSGWTDGQAAVIEHYEIYQSDTPISAISGMTAVYTTANAAEKSYTLTSLNNGQDYYFAVVAVTAGGKSAPGGGDAAVRPSDAITGLDTTPFALSIAPASIYTNIPGQTISVTLTEGGLTYGQDYTISISKGGASTTLLAWNAADGRIDVIETVTEVGADIWTVTASGMGTYSGIIEANFELEVLLSDAEAVAAAAAALDIGEAVGGDADAVRDGFTLPLKGIEGTDIAWQSTDTGIAIAPDGTVTVSRPAAGDADAPVTLQATISKGTEQEDKSFMLTIKAYPDTGNAADTAPGEPFGLRFSTWTENSIELSWSAPDAGKEGGSPGTISGYTVYYNSNNDFADLAALAGQSIDSASTTATVGGLASGQQYYFAISASNAHGESSVSQSKTTRTNAAPGTPLISARNAGDGQVEIVWAAARSAGWINGTAAAIEEYEIYQSNSAIADLTGQTAIHTSSALARTYTIDALTNGESYYFAVVTVSDINGRSAPGGGDIPVTPNDNLILLTSTQFSLSIDNAAALTNTAGQIIAVNLNEDNLVYGQDYGITVSKAGTATTEIAWNPTNRQLNIVAVLSAAGTEHYTLTASGMGTYSGIIERSFELQISLSAADAVAAAKAALDIREAAGGDLDAVTVPQIALPLSGINGTDIEWTSNNPNVISANGAVSRPAIGAFDAAVILKASIRKDGEEAEKSFTLTVKAQQPSGPSTVPDAIGSIVLSEWSESSVRLDWTEAHPGFIDGIRTSISAYTVYYNTRDDFSDLEALANQTVDAGTNLYAVIDGLESGKLYYLAVTASNTVGEGPVAQSVSTRTNSLPGRPLITERIPGNEEVQLSWLVPASAGWKDGTQASIVEYRIYQDAKAIDNVEQLSPVGSAQDMRYTASSLSNGQTYYFAVTAVNGHGEESLPAGGEVGISPTDIAPGSIKDDTSFLLSVEDAAAWTNTAGQTIDVDLDEDSLVYGQAYSIVISKAESEAPELYYDSGIRKIRVSDTLAASLVGDTTYTVTAHGMGSYKDSVTDDFVLTVSLSDADAVAADRRTLDISQEAGGNLNAVVIEHINLPANGPNGSSIAWTSNNPAVIADDGAVARPSIGTADAVVELTASIRKNSASSTRKFTLTVLALTGIANTAPGAPEDLQATPGELKITLSWIAPKDRGSVRGQSASSLTYSVSGHETLDAAQSIPGIGSIRGTVVEVENLKANTEYTFYVRASNSGAQSTPATINATALDISNLIEITAISYTPNTLELMAGQTIEAISPALTPDTVKPEDPRLSFAISPTDFEAQTGLDFDENTGRISGTASLTALVSYTISVLPDTGYYKGTPTAAMNIEVIPALTATWNPITATAFTPGAFGRPSLDSDKWTGSFIAASLPDGLDIDPATGEISGEPNGAYAAAYYQIELRGRNDYFGVNSSAAVNIRVNPKDLGETGFSITALSHSVVALTGDTAILSIDNAGLTPASDYTLSISPNANGNIRIDDTGAITIDAGITVSDAGVYTITATGQNDYTGTATAQFTLNVQTAALTSISYGGQPLAAVYNTAITALTATVEPAAAAGKVDFSIDPSLNSDTGLSFDTNSGRISGTPNKLLTQKSYTVTITGKTNTIYEGETKDVSIQVSVAQKDISDTAFAMTFDDKSDANEGAAASHSAASFETDGLIAATDYKLTITGPGGAAVDAVTIDNDGNINIGSGIDKGNTGLYSVTATGINNYTGTVGAAFTLTVRREITGISFTPSTLSLIPTQTMPTLTPTLTTGIGTLQDDDNISYSIDPDLNAANIGLTFDTGTGTISGTATKAAAAQDYTITVVPDAGHYTSTATATVDIEVTEALSASYSNIDATVNTAIATAGPTVNNANWEGKYSATLPGGLIINEDSGEINGTPTSIAAVAADYDVSLTGTGSYLGVDATATVTITVNPKLITSVTYAEVHAALTVEITPSAPTVLPDGAKVRYALDPSETLPGGLNLDPDSGAIEGTPEAGTNQDLTAYTILVSGTGDWLGSDIQATVNIKIDTAPEISASYDELSIRIRDTVDLTYNSITPGETATFTMASGESLPAGLTLGQDGRITGTATSITGIKTYNIVLTGTGTSARRSGTATVVITVEPKAITSVSYEDINAVYDTAITPVAPTKNPSGLTATYSSANLPTGLTVDSNGEISGQPTILQTTATESTITITGTGDWAGRSTTAALNITIGPKALSDVSGFSISGSGDVTALTGGSVTATVAGGLKPTSDYTLSIDKGGSSVAAVTINDAGNITIDSTITVNDTGTYTITATGQNNYTGDVTGTFALTVGQKALVQSDLGSISNAQSDFEITAGSGSDITRTLNFNGALAGEIGTDYTVGITAPSGAVASRVSLNSNTGELTISADIAPDDSGTYTVTATGQGNYKDTASATFELTVTAASVSIEYSDTTLTASYGEGITTLTPTITPSGADISYSISPNLKTNTGLDFDTNTGEISGTPSSLLSTTKYTVSITGTDGTKYDGATDSFEIDVTVEQRDIEGTLTYSHIDTTYGEVLAVTPQWSGGLAGQTVAYTINPTPPSDIIFTTGTGALSVSNMTAVHTGSYTITATGTGNYKGTKTFEVDVTVSAKTLSAAGFSISGTETVTALTGGSAAATVAGGLTHTSDYTLSISPNANGNISIDNDGTITIDSGITVSDAGDYTITATGQGNYSGTITGTFNLTVDAIPLTSLLLGSINNQTADFTVSAGITGNHIKTLSFDGTLSIGTDYSLVIKTRPQGATVSHVSLNSTTGVLIVTTDVVPDDAGTYTVTATGRNNYGSTTTASFTLSITPLAINTITYSSDVTAVYNTAMAAAVTPTVDPSGAAATYSIDPNLNAETGLDFSTATGVISGTATSILSSKDYTVTIAGKDGTKYDGSSTDTTVSVTVNPKSLADVSGFSVSAANLSTTAKTGGLYNATINNGGLISGSDYTLSIAKGGNTVTAVTIEDDGTITIGSGITFSDAGTYTITATGQGNYSGTKAANFEITVTKINISGTFSYADLEITDGQDKKSNASWNNAASGQTVSYSLVNSPSGIIIDENNGVVTVNASVVTADTTLTIRAEGTGSYTGEITADLSIFIREWIPSSVTLTYSDIRVFKGNSLSRFAQWSSGSYDVEYSMVPINGGTLPDGISIDSSSGEITVGSSAAAQADTLYKVTAAGINSWKGWKKADVRISVIDRFYYEFKPALVGQAFTLTPQNVPSAQFTPDTPLPPGLTLNSGNGVISGTPTTRQLATEYTITATPTGGGTAISNKVYLFIQQQASDKTHLWDMIDEEITAQGNNANLNLIDTSIITDMEKLFDSVSQGHHANYSSFNGDLSGWDVSRVTKMNSMFYGASAFNGDISEWNVSNVTNMNTMFDGARSFNGDLSGWNVSSVTNMRYMFRGAVAFNGDLSEWNVSKVTDMSYMFSGTEAFNGDLSGWNVSSVTTMNVMFSDAAAFNGDLSGWNISGVSSMTSMFDGARSFNGDISGWEVSRVVKMSRMFYNASSFNGDISGWTVNTGADMTDMFVGSGLENSTPAWYVP